MEREGEMERGTEQREKKYIKHRKHTDLPSLIHSRSGMTPTNQIYPTAMVSIKRYKGTS